MAEINQFLMKFQGKIHGGADIGVIFSQITIIYNREVLPLSRGTLSSALSAASSACDRIRDWVLGTPELGMVRALETSGRQAFGAKKRHMLGIYIQRSWIALIHCCIFLLSIYIFATPILKALGQPDDVVELSGLVVMCLFRCTSSLRFSSRYRDSCRALSA